MALIDIQHLTFHYASSDITIFDDVSFQIDTDWKIGFIGRNGRGKTTFLKLLMGELEYKGLIDAPYPFTYFPFTISDSSVQAIDLVEEVYPMYEYWRLQKELQLLDVNEEVLYRPFETLSKGEQTKLMLAILFLQDQSYVLIDEPTNHLDTEARQRVSQYLQKKKNFILVSHDREFIDTCIDHVLVINKQNIEIQQGNFSSWYQNKMNQDQFEEEANKKLKKDIKQLTKAAKRTANWSDEVEKTKYGTRVAGLRVDRGYVGHKSAKMMKRSKNIERRQQEAISQKSELLKNVEQIDDLKLNYVPHHKKQIFSLQEVAVYYGEKQVNEPISFTVEQGERVALVGKNGAGKSSILQVLLGEDMRYSGACYRASGLSIAYVAQDTTMLKGSLKEHARIEGIEESFLKTLLRKLDFSRDLLDKNIETFSSGQKKKVLLATALAKQANVYIFDEPLNYIDIFSRMQIEQALIREDTTIIFVEHDKAFTEMIATKEICITKKIDKEG